MKWSEGSVCVCVSEKNQKLSGSELECEKQLKIAITSVFNFRID